MTQMTNTDSEFHFWTAQPIYPQV